MITSLKDQDGKIIAYCEWRLVGQSGQEVPSGEYIWINDCWVHEDYRHTHKVGRIIDEVVRIVPNFKYGYFQRKDYNDKLRIFTKNQWERRRQVYDSLVKKEN